jgi:polysaccharide pyruvyl transferase WcaK-like protein
MGSTVDMTAHTRRVRHAEADKVTTVGFFGILGDGNIGNDASFESVLGYLRDRHPEAVIDAMCAGPERVRVVYGIDAIPFFYHLTKKKEAPDSKVTDTRPPPKIAKVLGTALKVPRIGIETAVTGLRIASWVRRHDVVIVPGMGVLEAALPIRPWTTPYQLLVLSLSGRIFNTKVALVCVGANPIHRRLTRILYVNAARLASYRSYRDTFSRDVMRRQGVNVTADHVYPDLAFALPVINDEDGYPRTVGIGVMAYYGSNDQRKRASSIHETYRETLKLLARQLINSGRSLRLFVGDNNAGDQDVIDDIVADIRSWRPDLPPERVIAEHTESFADIMAGMAPCSSVIAARFHNVLCALKLAKPTIATGYSTKHEVLMSDMGMEAYCMDIQKLDVDLIVKQIDELERNSAAIRRTLQERNQIQAKALQQQFAELTAVLLPSTGWSA